MADRQVILTRCPIGNATEIALQKGWLREAYESRGVKFDLLQNLPAKEIIKHFTQQAPLTFREGGNIPPIWAKSKGYETIVLGLTTIPQSHAIMVAVDSEITEVQQLVGKRLAVPKYKVDRVDFWRAMVLTGYETVLSHFGIHENRTHYVDIFIDRKESLKKNNADDSLSLHFKKQPCTVVQHQEELEELQAGRIDAFFAHGALVMELVQKGLARILIDILKTDLSNRNNIYPSVITANKDFALKNRDLVILYLEQVLRAAEWAKTHRSEVLEIVAKGQYGTTTEQVALSKNPDFHLHYTPGFSEQALHLLKEQKDFLLKRGFIEMDFSVEDWIDPDYLAEAAGLNPGVAQGEKIS
jgi:ABC-type nitrate/sulfonate/bicarbonate transport system substrate-binding protein